VTLIRAATVLSGELNIETLHVRLLQFFDCECCILHFAASNVDFTRLDY